MAPAIDFFAGLNQINNMSGSGLGFFGAGGFGASVQVGFFQGRTYITDGNGVNQGPEANNVEYLNAASGILGQASSGIALTAIPNYQSTLNIRFTNDTPCQIQNVHLTIFDRTSPANPPSGVTTAVAESVHPDPIQHNNGSGSRFWEFPAGTGYMTLTSSPGTSGLRPNGPGTTDRQHDWYVNLSASPNSIGSKSLYGCYVSMEYL